jgi:hypothetical protein
MKRLSGLLIALVVLVGVLWLAYEFIDVHPPFQLATPQQQLQVTVSHLQDDGTSYSIDVQYPQFGISAIDKQIAEVVNAAATEIRSYPANPPDSSTPKDSLTGSFTNAYIGPDIVSTELVLSQDTGGAHPNTSLVGLVFDRSTGRKFTVDDALRLTGLSLDQISTQAKAQLSAKLGNSFMSPDGVNADPQNFNSFIVSASDVTFIFQQYQVAPYSAGPQQVNFERKQ